MRVLKYKNFEYILREPRNYKKNEKYPVVIYLHGAGGRGRNIDLIKNHSFLKETESYLEDAISIMPQCFADSWFDIFEQLQNFVEYYIAKDEVDKSRVYLVGSSMGGYATWQLAISRPELFAAIIPICGGGMYWNAIRLKDMGVWAFHGKKDNIVYPDESKKMIEAINNYGGKAKLTIYDNCEHNAWLPTFKEKMVWLWLLSHSLNFEEAKKICEDVELFG